MQTKKFLQNIAFSSELYFIKAVDLKKLSVEKVDFHLPYDDYTVVLFLSSDGVVSVIRGENILNHTPDDEFVKTVIAYYSYLPIISFFLTLIKPIKRKFYINSFTGFTIHLDDIYRAKLPRGERNAQNAYQLNNKRWQLGKEEAQQRYMKLKDSLAKHGYDHQKPMYIMLNRKFGIKDQLLQGHHRIGLCKELGLQEVAVAFWAAPANFKFLRKLLNK